MIRLLIFIFLLYFLYRLLRRLLTAGPNRRQEQETGLVDEMVQDPVCKTYIPVRDAERKVIHGRTYFFCGKTCADKFEADKFEKEESV